ncbi:MAG: 16S rRNA (guanine(527)-N(7))-methyltransferase RsmG [Candidatus Onthovivens sp.]|nr:16S rRNA (guanine(527)-N(7))-methyltransferase RsmG [Candidatus Onthovivens sp.]
MIELLESYPFIKIDENQKNQLVSYMELTLKANESFNLTANDTKESFMIKNIIDSLLIVKNLDLDGKNILDLGSGAGLPGIPLAIYYKNTNFTLLEPLTKRANFLKEIAQKLGLKNVNVVNDRAEIFIKNARESFDFVTSRAVSRLNILLELSIPFLKVGGKLIAYKGINYQEEINESKNALDLLSSKIIAIEEENLVQINEKRYNIFIQKNQKTSQKYPREYRLIKKKTL